MPGEDARARGRRRLLLVALIVFGAVLVYAQRALSAWTDKTGIFLSALTLAFLLGVLLAWILDAFGPPLWRIAKSVAISIARAVRTDAEVLAALDRHPRVARWLRARLTPSKWTGWYLTATVVLALVFLSWFVSLGVQVLTGSGLVRDDRSIAALAAAFRTPVLTRVMWAATLIGEPWVMTVLAGLVTLLLLMWGKRRHAVLLIATMVSGVLAESALKLAFDRVRPPVPGALIHTPSSASFPSGHAFASLAFFGLLAFLGARHVKGLGMRLLIIVGAALGAFLVGLSRLYLGVHWMTDVLAGWALALAWLTLAVGAFLAWERYGPAAPQRRDVPFRQRTRLAVTTGALVVAFAAVVGAAQSDPLLARVVAPRPPVPLQAAHSPLGYQELTPADVVRLPIFSEKLDGSHQEPISLIFVGARGQLIQAFEASGWRLADPPTMLNVLHAAVSAAVNQPYPNAPVTPTFLGGRVQDLAFEKPLGAATIRRRHHNRWWKTDFTLGGLPIWVGTASLDSRLEIGSAIPVPTHHIEPDVDAERAYVVKSLVASGRVEYAGLVRVTRPLTGTNAQGDQWFTQGLAAEFVTKTR